MAYRNEGPFTLTGGEALADARLVIISASTAMLADAGEEPIGITDGVFASGEQVAIRPMCGGIERLTASKVIAAGASLYAANDGKVSDAAVGTQLGIAITAATGAGGIISAIIWGPRGGSDQLSAKGGVVEFFDDFFKYDPTATVGKYVVVEDAGATLADALVDGAGGILRVGCDGDDEDECYVASIVECFLFAADKPLFFEARVQLTEAGAAKANWIVGLSSVVAADTLMDAGAGVVNIYDGAVFFKVDDGTKIQFESSNAGTQTLNDTLATWTSATWYKLGFFFDPGDGTTGTITPFVDGVAGAAQDITLAGLEEMHILMGVKAGSAAEEAFLVDYVHVVQVR